MTSRPVEDAIENRLALSRIGRLQPLLQHGGIRPIEIAQHDALADVERRARAVFDQIGGRGHPQKDEGQPVEFGIERARIVRSAHGREEIIGKRQPQREINLVDKDHDSIVDLFQHHVAQEIAEPPHRTQRGALLPPRLYLLPDIQLIRQLGEEIQIPRLFGLAAHRREIDDGGAYALLFQALGCAYHQARLAHLACRENVAEPARRHGGKQLLVGRAANIRGRAGRQRAARHKELGGRTRSVIRVHSSLSLKYNSYKPQRHT